MPNHRNFQDNVWYAVQTRKGRRDGKDVQPKKGYEITKFFVSNLPAKCSSTDLQEVLKGFGDYEGSYIARKFDRLGKRFAFVSFRNVRDAKRLEGDMNDVWIGSYKLFIVLARFVDGEVMQRKEEERKAPEKDYKQKGKAMEKGIKQNSGVRIDGAAGVEDLSRRTFKDTVLNKKAVPEQQQQVIKLDNNIVAFPHRQEVSLLGRVVDLKTLNSLRTLLNESDGKTIGIKYLGVMSVLLVFQDGGERHSFLEKGVTWNGWFVRLEVWSGQFFEMDRIAWIRIYGVPVNLAMEPVFNVISKRYGVVIQNTQVSVFVCLRGGVLQQGFKNL